MSSPALSRAPRAIASAPVAGPLIVTGLVTIGALAIAYFQDVLPWTRGSDAAILLIVATFLALAAAGGRGVRTLALPLPLAMLGVLIVHFQFHLDFIVGLNDKAARFWSYDEVVMRSLLLSAAGVIALAVGYLIYRAAARPIAPHPVAPKSMRVVDTTPILVFASLLLFGYFRSVNQSYLSGNYGLEEIGGRAAYLIQAFRAAFFALIILRTRNLWILGRRDIGLITYLRLLGLPTLIMTGVYLTSVMFSGDRGPLITYSLCIFGNYLFLTKRFPSMKASLIFVAVGAIFISLLGDIRALDRDMGFWERIETQLTHGESRFDYPTVISATQNLGASIRTLHTVVEYVPSYHPFILGDFQLKQVMSVFPFYSAIEDKLGFDRSYRYRGSPQFTTWIVQGDNPYSGEGTTSIADLYLSFGFFGVVGGMLLFGLLLGRADRLMTEDRLPGLLIHCVSIFVFASAIYLSRAPLLVDFKLMIWAWAFAVINVAVAGSPRSAGRPRIMGRPQW